MIDIALDPTTGDILLVDHSAQLVQDIDQVAQNLAIRLRFILGEWYLNILAGVPYYEYFFVKSPNQIQVESFLKEAIVDTPGILQITSFSSAYDNAHRRFSVNFSAQTESGNLTLNLELP